MKLSMPRGLFRKYLIFLLILVGGLLSISSAVELYFSYQETKQSIVRLERTKALAAASEIERYLEQILQHLRGTMQGAIDVSALGTAGTGTQAGGTRVQPRSRNSARSTSCAYCATSLRSKRCAIWISRARSNCARRVSRSTRSTVVRTLPTPPSSSARKPKRPISARPYFRDETEPFITMAVAPDETAAEVTAAEVNIRAIWDVVTRIGTGRAGNAYVVDSNDQLIAHP
jgi:hypothetical protein